ncbi:MAG: gas vesicle protein GvpG [Rhizobiaceae bacterium]
MGILSTLLTLPVSGPLSGVRWLSEKIVEAAESQVYDPAAIKAELAMHEARLEAGEMSEDEYEELEMALLLRLKEARAQGR